MKRVGYLMEQISSIDNLYLAYHKACRGKRCKYEVRRFAEHFEENIRKIKSEIEEGSITVGDYHYFTIHDPKERIICAAAFRERILQHAIMNICHKYFDRNLIDTTYATRKGKGVYAALNKAMEGLSHCEYSVKLDFCKYYDSIDHNILKEKLRKIFKDRELLLLFDRIIDSYCVYSGKGLPIGNLTSQYFANIYLSELDHKVKEVHKQSLYIRYMDDILITGNDLSILKLCVRNITEYASEELKLRFKPPIFRSSKEGQVFLGYKIKPFHIKMSGRSKRRFRSKLLKYEKLLHENIWTQEDYKEHILPLFSFAQHAVSSAFRKECLRIV